MLGIIIACICIAVVIAALCIGIPKMEKGYRNVASKNKKFEEQHPSQKGTAFVKQYFIMQIKKKTFRSLIF